MTDTAKVQGFLDILGDWNAYLFVAAMLCGMALADALVTRQG